MITKNSRYCIFVLSFLFVLGYSDHVVKAQSNRNDQIAVSIETFPDEVKRNDIILSKVSIKNISSKKIDLVKPPRIENGTLRFYLKKPNSDIYKKLNYGNEDRKDTEFTPIPIHPNEKYTTYQIIHISESGIVTSETGPHKITAAIDYKDSDRWTRSDPVSFTVVEDGALSEHLIKTNKETLRSFFWKPAPFFTGPYSGDDRKAIKSLIKKLEPSNVKQWLQWNTFLIKIEETNGNIDDHQVQNKLKSIKTNMGALPYEIALHTLMKRYVEINKWGKANRVLMKLKDRNPGSVHYRRLEKQMSKNLQEEK